MSAPAPSSCDVVITSTPNCSQGETVLERT
jgi:hypothetical protein